LVAKKKKKDKKKEKKKRKKKKVFDQTHLNAVDVKQEICLQQNLVLTEIK
jgi:hypothetical protein